MLNIKYFLVVHLLFSFCLCEISNGQKEKLLNGFLQYYNGLPNQVYFSQEGSLLNTQQVDDTTFQIVANVRVAEINNADAIKLLKCTATIKDSDNVVTVSNNNCEDVVEQKQGPVENPETTLEAQVEVSEPTVERKPVQLDNEVQADTAITSGEQFIAIPRDQPSAPCVGCASHVNPQAAGVSELANLGVRDLDLHEPAVKHSLDSVIDVERQVQVVNGVRYILTLSIHSNNCTQVESDEYCASSKICKITILVKPWVKLSNGGNYRAILANNCTEEWLFGEDGEVLPEPSTGDNPVQGNTSVDPGEDDIQIKHNSNVQSQPNQEKVLTEDDLKKIQEQIITYAQFQEVTESDQQSFTTAPDTSDVSKQHVFKIESDKHTDNSIPVTESEKTEHQVFNINLDKKKIIDDMLDFFDFSGFKPKTEAEDIVPRVRRSYDYDLQVLSLAEDFHGIKNSIENARFMYTMAQAMVDYLNEMDMEVKNRAVKNVIRAEEEKENLQRFIYIQARVTIPCDKVECQSKDVNTQICNGVLECSNENSPQILTTFCYNDNKESNYREDIKEISLDDPVLREMAEEAVKQIESESKSQYALRINKIASAITQITSGTLTKFSVIVENIKCNKSVPLPLRMNCTILEQLGTKICDVIVHERHWLKEKRMSYTCTDRPADMRISKGKKVNKNVTTDDPEIIEMLQEAIQYLESQSDKAYKQKIVSIQSISSQIIAGFLTKIEFVVGYTDCTDENYSRDQINKCELLKGEGLRSCKAQLWDRSWIMDGRQIEVSCDDVTKYNEIVNTRKKRSIDSTSDQEQRSLRKDSDLDFKQLANESLYKFMQSSSSHQHYEVVKVDKAVVQDVSRKLIKIDFSISPTDCLIQNDRTLSSSECEIVNPKNIIHCRSKILESNWINRKQYFVKCKIKYQPQKYDNDLKERNPSDSKYYRLAEESLAKYLQDTGNPHHVIVRVEKVTTQVVSGLLTRIDFIVSPKSQTTNDSKKVRCHSEILEKHWLGTKAFNVSCQMNRYMNKINYTVDININYPKYMQIAVESLQKYIKNNPESKLVRVAFVDKVARKDETLIIRFISSHTDNGDGDTVCFAEVSETIESKSEVDVKCHFIGTIFREAEIIEDDPNYYKYVQLADECLNNYLQKTNSSLYTLVSIESVTVKWDEGIKTLIDFNISPDLENSELTQGRHCIAETLEQPWIHKYKIIQDVKCELDKDLNRNKRRISNDRVRRQLSGTSKIQFVGGQTAKDPTEPQYKVLAEESLRKYVVDSGITQPLAVVQVEKVTIQVVAGTLTRLDFLVSGSSDSTTVKCKSEVWEQPWLKKKEISVTCQNDGHRSKRGLPGGLTEQDPKRPEYKALAEESLRKYVVDSGITEPLAVAQVEKVSTQVVAGALTRLDFLVSGSSDSTTVKCHSEVWERPWLKKKEINVTCQNDGHRSKRGLPGGQTEQDPKRPEYKALAEESLRKYMVDSGITQPLAVAQVEKVSTQVVAGTLTRLDFLVSGSSDSTTVKCKSEVWERPWLNKKEIKVTCQNDGHRGKRRLVGGVTDQDTTDPKYQALAKQSLRKYTIDSGIRQPLEIIRIDHVTTQEVAGFLTRIDFVVSVDRGSTTIFCHSKILEQGFLNHKEIDVSCHDEGIDSSFIDQDPTEPRYKALAMESLRKYVIDSGITQRLEVERVEKVITQVVSGMLEMTGIDFIVSGSDDTNSIKCHSDVRDRPSLNQKDITIACLPFNERVKRDLRMTSRVSEDNINSSKFKLLVKEWVRGNSSSNNSDQHVRNLRGHGEEEQEPNKPEYKQLAGESLHKLYRKKSTVYHKVVDVQRVVIRVVSGLKYEIDFTAAPTSCSVNVSSVRARSCKADDDVLLYCHSEIWDRPWLRQKKIDVQCNGPKYDNDDFAEYESDNDSTVKPSDPQNNNDEKYMKLAEEASEKYLTTSNRKYVHKVTEILSASEQVADGTLINIEYSLSPTTCLRNETTNTTSCKLKQPLVVFHCNANIQIRPWLNVEKQIVITCKKNSGSKKRKRELVARKIRQTIDDDDEIDEDTTYYYADRAVQHLNDRSNSNNLHKLITIHAIQSSVQMGTLTVKMYIDVAETFCLRHHKSKDLRNCEEMSGLNHRLCMARLWPSPDDELVVRHVSVVCEDEEDFITVTGVNVPELIRISVAVLESQGENKFKLIHQGEPQLLPTLDSRRPFKLNLIIAVTNCSRDVNLDKNPFQCYLNPTVPARNCRAFIWLKPEAKYISNIEAHCTRIPRFRRSALDPENGTLDYSEIQSMVRESLEQLEMQSLHRYKQRVLQINSHSTKITSGKVTTIDFDVGYTSCLKYEWVANITSCNFLEHLPRRRCVAQIWERLWVKNGKNIDVNCVDDETPLESHIEFESAEMANELARQALKHIEAKYPHPSKQIVVRIFSLEKQVVAGIHYKMKVEIGFTDCLALTDQKDCKLVTNYGLNKFCRVNVWIRPWTDHPPNFRVSCDFQEGATRDLYHHVQAEHLFYNFLTTYSPSYVNDYSQMHKRFEIFKNNIKKIHELNVHEKGTALYGVTRFTDLTYEEFSTTFMGLNMNLTNENQVPMKQADIPNIKVPENFDWREYDAVTEVKDQGSCGSCWAFSVTGNIEGQWKMQSGQLVSLSEQELVDCDKLDNGCNGGLPDNAYRAIEQMGGLELESDYPYEGSDDKCVFNKTLAKVQISSAVNITSNETGMAQWLVHNGPISIGINANAMQFYMGGISHPWKMLCNPTNLDHGVLIVGYGVKDYPLFHKKLPYWIVKNSWGKSWGEQGYYRVYRGDGTCGLNQMASSAVI